jgi:succinate dehydrogenase / fumarate reductase, flavoprotein subunit
VPELLGDDHEPEEDQTDDGEAKRDDDNFSYVAAWEWSELGEWDLHREDLAFEHVELATRKYA